MRIDSLHLEEVFLGTFRLDGGAMFGVVPRKLWSQKIAPDSENRIPLALRCLLIHSGRKKILIDTGMGCKWSAKDQQIYDVPGAASFSQNFQEFGIRTFEEITHVFLTHLHFDHAGGMTFLDKSNQLQNAFPNAEIFLQSGNLENALRPNPRERASYREENWLPYLKSSCLNLVDSSPLEILNVLPEISVIRTDGHTNGQQIILVGPNSSQPVLYCGDLLPTAAHVPLSWGMGYDVQPLLLMEEKQEIFKKCVELNWMLYFEHDPNVVLAKIQKKERPSGFLDFEFSQDLTETFRAVR